jgi:hypothetical protein
MRLRSAKLSQRSFTINEVSTSLLVTARPTSPARTSGE